MGLTTSQPHEIYLQQALALATIRRGFCAPNPAVGAMLVKNDVILATGYHYASGHPHAEAAALKNLTESVQDATLYVTLEPCCHTAKKTPPCTDLLISRGIKSVIYGFQDPNPEVAGRGEQQLRAASIKCLHYPVPEINSFYQSYAKWWQTKQPLVTAKIALSLDGKIAGPGGKRVSISGVEAQLFTHRQRKLTDAILTSARTIANDKPLLNVRLANEQYSKPVYVLDRFLTTSLAANIFTTAAKLTFFHDHAVAAEKIRQFEEHGARCFAVRSDQEGLSLTEILSKIGGDGMHDVWLEAGGLLFTAFAKAGLLQCAYIYVSPKVLGQSALSAFNKTIDFLGNAKQCQWEVLGEDVVCKITW